MEAHPSWQHPVLRDPAKLDKANRCAQRLIGWVRQGRIPNTVVRCGVTDGQFLGGSSMDPWYIYVYCFCPECTAGKPELVIEDDDDYEPDPNPEVAKQLGQGVYSYKWTRIMSLAQFLLHCNPGLQDRVATLDADKMGELSLKHISIRPHGADPQHALYLDDAFRYYGSGMGGASWVNPHIPMATLDYEEDWNPRAAQITGFDPATGVHIVQNFSPQGNLLPKLRRVHLVLNFVAYCPDRQLPASPEQAQSFPSSFPFTQHYALVRNLDADLATLLPPPAPAFPMPPAAPAFQAPIAAFTAPAPPFPGGPAPPLPVPAPSAVAPPLPVSAPGLHSGARSGSMGSQSVPGLELKQEPDQGTQGPVGPVPMGGVQNRMSGTGLGSDSDRTAHRKQELEAQRASNAWPGASGGGNNSMPPPSAPPGYSVPPAAGYGYGAAALPPAGVPGYSQPPMSAYPSHPTQSSVSQQSRGAQSHPSQALPQQPVYSPPGAGVPGAPQQGWEMVSGEGQPGSGQGMGVGGQVQGVPLVSWYNLDVKRDNDQRVTGYTVALAGCWVDHVLLQLGLAMPVVDMVGKCWAAMASQADGPETLKNKYSMLCRKLKKDRVGQAEYVVLSADSRQAAARWCKEMIEKGKQIGLGGYEQFAPDVLAQLKLEC